MLKKKASKRCIPLLLSLVMVMCTIFTFAVSPVGVSAATQATYYVSPTGSDSNPGTLAAPFQTITKARDVVRTVNSNMTGDIYVYLRGGNYSITSTVTFGTQDSGTNGYRIYYQAYPGETPVLNGATKVTGWTQHSGSIYKATLNRSTKLRNLYVNDQRASMTKKTVTARGGYGTYSVTAGQASWAWTSGSKSDGVQYYASDVPAIASNKDDLEIVNGTTWNENIVCTRDVITSGSNRVLLLQQPYGSIAQTPGWGAAFGTSGTHTIYNAFEFLNSPGQFYFDKTTKTLYYYMRSGENMATADVEAPVVEKLIDIAGSSTSNRVKNITFQGITFVNTDYSLVNVGGSRGKSTCQAAQAFIAFYNDNWHNTKYDLVDTLPGMINVTSSDSINFISNVVKHSGSDGISMVNDVINSSVIGNYITDITSSGVTVGHPQHVYIGDGGNHAKYAPGIEGVCKNDTISNNMLYDTSTAPGFGGCAAITAYFVDTINITYNHVQSTAYNGIHLGWGWCNFLDSTTCKNNTISYNRIINPLTRLHDSGGIYTIGQMPGTNINQNYVKGVPSNASGPTYGLHNDEGTAYINENDNVLDIDPGVTYTINCEDYGQKHDLTILRTYATVNKMGKNPPNSRIDTPIVVSDNVWPVAQYNTCLNSGVQESYRSIIPGNLLSTQNYVFPASCATTAGTTLNIRSSGDSSNTVWFAPSGTTNFVEGANMTKAAGTATSITVPYVAGTYRLCVVNSQGAKLGESSALLRVTGSAATPTPGTGTATPTPTPSGPTATPAPTPSGSNLALGKTASADSEQSANPAANGNDGNTSTRWCANDGNANHWWKVDLGSTYNITGSEVTWEKSATNYKYKVEVSTDNTNWTLAADKTANTSTAQTQTDSFSAAARYVRITVTGLAANTWASFFEFKVLGDSGPTATPTPTPSGATATPTPTPDTATATPTPTPTTGTPAPGGIKVQFFNGNTAASTNTIYPNFKVVNTGTAAINLSDVKMRYYFTNDGTQADSFACDYSTVGAGNVTSTFATITGTNADRYLEVGFTSGAGTLAAGGNAEVKGRVWKSDWSNFTQTNDYSFNGTATNYVDATTVTGYLAGALKWGTEP